MALSFESIRVGKKYILTNYGERAVFQVMEKTADNDFRVKDLHTLESYMISDLIRYGKGKDYDFYEMEK
jgi:hypothetical protein